MKNRQLYLVVIGVLLLTGAAWADDDEDRGRGGGTPEAYGRALEYRLVQVGAFNPAISQATTGTDQLAAGANHRLSVQHDRTVQVEFVPTGLPAGTNPVYRVWFCRYGGLLPPNAINGCVALLDPASQTSPPANAALKPDSAGAVRGTAVFPKVQTSDIWVGSFVVSRDGVDAAQFVSAIDFQTPPNQSQNGIVNGPEMEVSGEIASLDAVKKSFTLTGMQLEVRVDASTRFDGRPNSIQDLEVGMSVNVRGVVQTDTAAKTSFLLAERVRAEHGK